jgi:hypothetical protein
MRMGKDALNIFVTKTISELINEKGNHISEQSKILFEQEQYYRKLYSSNHLCVDNLSDERKILWRGIYHSRNVVNLLN